MNQNKASIGIRNANGTVSAITVERDGYPAGVGVALCGIYNTVPQVEALLALGNLKSIAEELDACEVSDGGRQTYKSEQDYQHHGIGGFRFLFDEGRWCVCGFSTTPDWIGLEVEVVK